MFLIGELSLVNDSLLSSLLHVYFLKCVNALKSCVGKEQFKIKVTS